MSTSLGAQVDEVVKALEGRCVCPLCLSILPVSYLSLVSSAQLNQERSEKEALTKECVALREEQAVLKTARDTALADVERLRTGRNVFANEAEILKKKNEGLAQELTQTREALAKQQLEHAQTREALAKEQLEHKELANELAQTREALAKEEKKHKAATEDTELARRCVVTKQATIDAMSRENFDLRKNYHDVASLQAVLQDERRLREAAVEEAARAVARADQLAREVTNLERNNAILRANASEDDQRVKELEAQLAQQAQLAQIFEMARSPARKKSAKPHPVAVLNTSPAKARPRRSLSAGASVSTSVDDEASENSVEQVAQVTRRSGRRVAQTPRK